MKVMLKKTQIVMLPTNEKAENCLAEYYNGLMSIAKTLLTQSYIKSAGVKTYHLYFLSDEEIKEGDWYIFNVGYAAGVDNSIRDYREDDCKKIIATTDSSIMYSPPLVKGIFYYPQPSPQFLEVFVREYNKRNKIEEVMVEYEEYVDIPKEHLLTDSDVERECMKHPYWKAKVNPKDNTITIKRVKESWSREEVINFARIIHFRLGGRKNDFDTYIEQNL